MGVVKTPAGQSNPAKVALLHFAQRQSWRRRQGVRPARSATERHAGVFQNGILAEGGGLEASRKGVLPETGIDKFDFGNS